MAEDAGRSLESLVTLLRRECEDAELAFYKEPWIPIGVGFSHPHHRSVRLLDCEPIGFGSFGAVFAVALSVSNSAGAGGGGGGGAAGLRYVPAAMKVSLCGTDYATEVSNGLAMNDLMASGATPGITRVIDAFAICGRKMSTSMPSLSWTRFWDGVRSYVARPVVRDSLSNYYGKVPDSADAIVDAVRARGSLFFHFTELSLQALSKKKKRDQGGTGGSDSPVPPTMLHSNRPGKERGLVVDLWQRWQTLAAVHEAGALHGDLHRGNFISHASGRARTSICRLSDAAARASAATCFGVAGRDRPPDDFGQEAGGAWRLYAIPTQVEVRSSAPEAGYQFACVALSPDDPAVTLIDYGGMFRGNAPRGTNRDNIRREWEPFTGKLPAHIVSENVPRYDPNEYYRRVGVLGTPGSGVLMGLVNRPTTALLARPPEVLNPPAREETSRVVYSELSDVFSLAASCVAEILGFEPFGDHLLVNTQNNAHYSLGIRARLLAPGRGRKRSFVPLCESGRSIVKFCADRRYAGQKQQPPGFESLVVSGDEWVTLEQEVPNAMCRALGEAREHKALIRDWLGRGRDLYLSCHSMVARVLALGRPSSALLRNTLFGVQIRKHFPREDDARDGWLEPTLRRVLCRYYSVPVPLANDFVQLVMHALSWDPAARPRASSFLECRVFRSLYRELGDFGLERPLLQLWSAQTPTVNTWPTQRGTLLNPSQVTPHTDPVVPGMPIAWSIRAQEACRAISRIQYRDRTYTRFPGFLSKRTGRALKVCPRQSYLFYYFAFVMGALDIYDGATLSTLRDDDDDDDDGRGGGAASAQSLSAIEMPGLRGRTRNMRNYRAHLVIVSKQIERLPDWLCAGQKRARNSCLGASEPPPPPPPPPKRARTHK